MNSLVIFPEEVSQDGRALIEGARAKDLIERHELAEGLTLRASVIGGGRGRGTICKIGKRLEIELVMTENLFSPSRIHLIVAVPRPQTIRKILRTASPLGIHSIHFIRAKNVVKSYLSSKRLEPKLIREDLLLGLEQSTDSILPEVNIHPKFLPFIEDELPSLSAQASLKIIAEPTSTDRMIKQPQSKGPIFLAIGPEAGWDESEILHFRALGFQPISLGQRIMRVDTAITFLAGQIETLISSFIGSSGS